MTPTVAPSGGPTYTQGSDAHTQVHARHKSAGGQSTNRRDGQGHSLPGGSNGEGKDSGTLGPAWLCVAWMCSLGCGLGHLHTRAHTCTHITLGDGDVMCGPSPNNAGSLEGGTGFALGCR